MVTQLQVDDLARWAAMEFLLQKALMFSTAQMSEPELRKFAQDTKDQFSRAPIPQLDPAQSDMMADAVAQEVGRILEGFLQMRFGYPPKPSPDPSCVA